MQAPVRQPFAVLVIDDPQSFGCIEQKSLQRSGQWNPHWPYHEKGNDAEDSQEEAAVAVEMVLCRTMARHANDLPLRFMRSPLCILREDDTGFQGVGKLSTNHRVNCRGVRHRHNTTWASTTEAQTNWELLWYQN